MYIYIYIYKRSQAIYDTEGAHIMCPSASVATKPLRCPGGHIVLFS